MPKRPRSHELEDQSRNCLHEIFTSQGWTVENLAKDYGEDLLVRIFSKRRATPLAFFVQAKAADNISKYLNKAGTLLMYPISTEHLKHWDQFWQPVLLTVWDSRSNTAYWECIQTYCEGNKRGLQGNSKSIRVSIRTDNKLDKEGLARIESRTRSRFTRFVHERAGAKALLEILNEEFGLKIEYDPQYGFVSIPEGRFVPDPEGRSKFFFFGQLAAQIRRMQKQLGMTSDEILHGSLHALKKVFDLFAESGKLVTRDAHGNIVEWKSLNDLVHEMNRRSELDDE
jgi:hypothetical protein